MDSYEHTVVTITTEQQINTTLTEKLLSVTYGQTHSLSLSLYKKKLLLQIQQELLHFFH
jgi:hypothetical protein